MSSSLSKPQPGTPGSANNNFSRNDIFVEMDIRFCLETKDEASQPGEITKLNNLRLVSPAGATEATDINYNDINPRCSTEVELERKLEALEAKLDIVQTQYEEAKRKIAEQQEMFETHQGLFKKEKAKLNRAFVQISRKKDEELHNLNDVLKQKNLQILTENTVVKNLSKEMAVSEARYTEDLATKEREAKTDTMELERQLHAMNEEVDLLKTSQIRLMTKIRHLAELSGIDCPIEADVISDKFLLSISNHIVRCSPLSESERAELEKNRNMLEQLENLFVKSRSDHQQLNQRQYAIRSSKQRQKVPSYAEVVTGKYKSCNTEVSCTSIVENEKIVSV